MPSVTGLQVGVLPKTCSGSLGETCSCEGLRTRVGYWVIWRQSCIHDKGEVWEGGESGIGDLRVRGLGVWGHNSQ